MLIAVTGCGPTAKPPAAPQLIRLLDEGPVRQSLPFDVNDRASLLAATSTPLLVLEAGQLTRAAAVVIRGDNTQLSLTSLLAQAPSRLRSSKQQALLSLQTPETLLRPLKISDTGPLWVRTWVEGEEASIAILPQRDDAASGNDPHIDTAAFAARLSATGLSLAGSGDREGCWMSTVVPADPARRDLVLVAIARFHPMAIGRTEVRRLSPLAAELLRPGLRPAEDQVMLRNQTREAVVLPCGSEITWELTVPRAQPQLEFDIASLAATSAPTVRWEVTRLSHAGESLPGEVQILWTAADGNPESWSPRRLELSPVAGQRVSITLSVEGRDGAALIGRPIIVGQASDGDTRHPDVLLVVLDTLRADRTAPGASMSPRIQALADKAVRFTQASSTSSWTLPSHASLFTSRWPQAHGVTDKFRRLDESTPRLARAFRDAGYETVAFTGGGFVSPQYGMSAGFERYGVTDPCALGTDSEGGDVTRQVGSRVALKELLAEPERRPVFAFVHTFAAHHGMPRGDELASFGLDAQDFLHLRDVLAELTAAQLIQQTQTPDAATIADIRALYDASVVAVDELVGDIVDTLVASGRFRNTVLVVTSDHGQELFERGAFGHGHQLHSELLRIPLVILAPGSIASTVDTPVSLVDLAPTLRELAGLPPDSGAHGRSLVPLLRGKALSGAANEAPQLSHLAYVPSEPSHHLRRDNLSLHLSEDRHGTLHGEELFDLANDPNELNNLLDRRSAVASALQADYAAALSALQAESHSAASQVTLDPETRQRLIELGYLSDG
ncbi:MAG: arylsulfatase A-like enzyme [Pseudohongiellaceae bacterium]